MADDYGARRPGQVVWLAVAGLLVVVLVVGGGWLAWRGTATAAARAEVAGAPASVQADAPVAFGAPTLADGVPWGFPLTADGAASAATTAVTVTGQPDVVFDPDRFAQVAAVVFAPDEAASQAREVDAARVQFEVSGWADQPPSRRMYHFTPLAVRIVRFDPTVPTATVEVWAMTLVGVGDRGGSVFTTSEVDLHPDDTGDTWQVVRLDTVQGPTPMVEAPPTAPGRTRALVRDALPTLPLPVGEW